MAHPQRCCVHTRTQMPVLASTHTLHMRAHALACTKASAIARKHALAQHLRRMRRQGPISIWLGYGGKGVVWLGRSWLLQSILQLPVLLGELLALLL